MNISTLLLKHRNKKQEPEECNLKLCGYIHHQGTYTPQAVTEKGAGFFYRLPFTGVSTLLQKHCNKKQLWAELFVKMWKSFSGRKPVVRYGRWEVFIIPVNTGRCVALSLL